MKRKPRVYDHGHTDEEVGFFCEMLNNPERARADLEPEEIRMAEKFVSEGMVDRAKEGGRVYYRLDAQAFYKGDSRFDDMQFDLRQSNRS